MKRFFFLLLISVTWQGKISAQVNLPPVYVFTTDTILSDTLPGKYWQMLDDKAGNLNIDQVRQSPFSEQFYYNPAGRINTKIKNNWFRFSIMNATGHEIKFGLYDHQTENSEWYIIDKTGQII